MQSLNVVARLRALASIVSERAGLAAAAGATFGGERDVYAALGYAQSITPAQYRSRYKRNAVAARIVEAMPKATWRGGGELIEDEDPEKLTTFEEAFIELDKRLKIWSALQKADILAGLGEYAVILIGAPGDLETPLTSAGGDALAYLQPYSQDDAPIDKYVTEASDPRFGLPELYGFKRVGQGSSKKVHFSRVVHIADGSLDSPILGTPRLERVWNLIDDLEKVTGAGAEAFWLQARMGLQLDLDKDVEMGPDEEQKLSEEVDEYAHNLRRIMRTRGVKVNPLKADVTQFDKNVDAILVQISAGTGIPHRILTGSERGELASSQDKNNWNERIQARRKEFAAPHVVRQLVDRLIELSALPTPVEYDVRWSETKDMSDEERADYALKLASVNEKAGEVVFTGNEIRDRAMGWPPLSDVDAEADARNRERDPHVDPNADPSADPNADDEPDPADAPAPRRAASVVRLVTKGQRALVKKKTARGTSNGSLTTTSPRMPARFEAPISPRVGP